MFRWLSHWGHRLWRSCCYPFRFLISGASPNQARDQSSSAPFDESIDSRPLSSDPNEAIRWEALSLPGTEQTEQPTTEQSLVIEQPPITEQPASDKTNRKAFSQATKPAPPVSQSAIADLPVSWVIQQRLAIGPMPKKRWASGLQSQGICVVLSLCDEAEGKLPKAIAEQFRCLRVPLPDGRYRRALTLDELEEAVDLIHWHVQKQQPVYLHCLAGIERSPLVAIAYLCRYRAMDLLDAVNWLSHVHSRSRPLPAQLQVVREYLRQH